MKRTRLNGVPLGPLPWGLVLVNYAATLPPGLLRTLLLRGAVLWLLARLMGKAVLAVGGVTAASSLPAWVVAMTASLTLVDLHRRREVTLLHNLGITTSRAVITATLPALALEAILVMLP